MFKIGCGVGKSQSSTNGSRGVATPDTPAAEYNKVKHGERRHAPMFGVAFSNVKPEPTGAGFS